MTSAQALLDAVAQRLAAEPRVVLPALRLLARPDALAEPADEPTENLARRLSGDRIVARRTEFRAHALDTAQVRQLLGGVSRQAVAQRVTKGQLLATQIAGRLYFPDWQFGPDGAHRRLHELLGPLLADGRGVLAADALMRRSMPEEGGKSPADLVAEDRLDLALHYLITLGAGF